MNELLLYVLGVVLFVLAISLSIALHELGHLVPAKKFGVKVTQYMIGFGPTVVSFRRGETEYGIKALPLGGFIAMPGMYPPLSATQSYLGRRSATRGEPGSGGLPRLFARSVADARAYSNEQIAPGEEHRTFYALSVPKRLVIMCGGPCVNLLLGIVILGISLLGIGTVQPTNTVATVVECAIPASEAAQRGAAERNECRPGDTQAPAWAAGIAPGDTITEIGGVPVDSWDDLRAVIRERAGQQVPITVERGDETLTLTAPIIESERPRENADSTIVRDDSGNILTERAGFLGISPAQAYRPMPPAQFPGRIADALGATFHALATLPVKLVGLTQTALGLQDRDEAGPMGVVGVGRMAGEIVSADAIELGYGQRVEFAALDKVQLGLGLLGSLNLFLFAFNMVPLLPLDGGHIFVALYEGLRRQVSRWRGRGPVGAFDTASLLPLTYIVIGLFLTMTVLLVYVDIVKPVRLSQLFG